MMEMKKTAAFLLAMMAAATAMTMSASAVQFIGGDMDGDDDVDAADAALILQYAAYVGAGGTQSIYEYITGEPDETPDQGETENKAVIEEMSGMTLSEVIDAGYDVNGYIRYSDVFLVYADSVTYTDDTITTLVDSLTGKTVREMVDEYDISIGYFGFGGEYTFFSSIGSVDVSYELAHGAEAIRNHEDESFYDLEDAEEIQSDVLENIEMSDVTFSIELDDASLQKILAADDIDVTYIRSIADELIISEMYYTTK